MSETASNGATEAPPSGLVQITLVPVEVFGTDDCCTHFDEDCKSQGYGIMDAVQAWSDCNRAIGRIYRVDDTDTKYRLPGETVKIWVDPADLPWFEKQFGDRFGGT